MIFREMAIEMSEDEIRTAFYIVQPEGIFKRFEREEEFIRVWYSLPNDKNETEHRLDLLPDDVYFIKDDVEADEMPLDNVNALFTYRQLMIARGYSFIWKGNPYII